MTKVTMADKVMFVLGLLFLVVVLAAAAEHFSHL